MVDSVSQPPGPTSTMMDNVSQPPGLTSTMVDNVSQPPGPTSTMVDNVAQPPGPTSTMMDNLSQPPGPTLPTTSAVTKSKKYFLPSALQVSIILLGSLGHLSLGMALTWPNTLTSHLMVDNTTLLNYHLHLSDTQLNLTGSAMFLATTVAYIPVAWLMGRVGRRLSVILANIPFISSWLMLAFAYNFHMIIIGRCLAGIALALLMTSGRIYMSEIANTNIRGMVIAYLDLMKGIGYALTPGLGIVLPWYHIAFVNIGILCIFCTTFIFIFPESPACLAVNHKGKEALHVLRQLRPSSEDIEEEVRQIQLLNTHIDGQSRLSLLLNRSVLKKGLMVIGLLLFYGFTGCELIKSSLTRMMQHAGITLNLDITSVMIMSVMLGGSLIMSGLVDRLGRRLCLIISLILLAAAYTVLGTLIYMVPPLEQLGLQTSTITTNLSHIVYDTYPRSTYSSTTMWIKLVCFMTIAFGINFGIGSVTLILVVEYFPTSIRAEGTCVSLIFGTGMTSLGMQLYSTMMDTLKPSGFYWCYGTVSALGVLYVWLVIQETSQIHIG